MLLVNLSFGSLKSILVKRVKCFFSYARSEKLSAKANFLEGKNSRRFILLRWCPGDLRVPTLEFYHMFVTFHQHSYWATRTLTKWKEITWHFVLVLGFEL